jgi:hypothetical protein
MRVGRLLDTEIEIIEAIAELVRRKARRLLGSPALLLAGVACLAGGILVNEPQGVLNG